MGKGTRNTLDRRTEILKLLEKEDRLSVSKLSKLYEVSEVSIRNDLGKLEDKGLLIRTRGGAIKKQPVNFDLSLNMRVNRFKKEKQRIGKKAIELISEGDTIVMDSGSTTLEISKNLGGFKNIKLITNSLPIAEQVADFEGVEVIIAGGILRPEMRSLIGPMAESNLRNYYCDIAFLGADGIEFDKGIYTPVIHEATLSKTMMEIAKKVVLVSDSSKFGRKSFVKIGNIDMVHAIISDIGIPDAEKGKIEDSRIDLFLV